MNRLLLFSSSLLTVSPLFAQDVTFTGTELLGRPTSSSITINVVANEAIDAYFEYGTSPGNYTVQTATISSQANEPLESLINGLQKNTRYYYRMQYRKTGTTDWLPRAEHTFFTQRQSGAAFKFDITSDSHVNVGGLGNATTWQRTLTNIGNDIPDFLIDCGDTFSMDNVTSENGARSSYIFQRSATTFGVVSASTSVFLALGNHEEQEGWHLNDNGNPVNSQPVWGANAQKRYFLNPVPNAFYSGNSETYFALDGDRLREDYYAWTWGNALFVVIDPYWYTTSKPFIGNIGGGEPGASDGDRWHWTLGDAQFNWLKQTLENSTASFKFLFMHHMTGGTEDYIRGGAYGAKYCEWGGYNENGTTYAFPSRRPSWYAPVHQLLIDNHVSAVFHGHDHQYAYELLDGVVYQSLPAAGFAGNGFNIYNQSNELTIRALPSGGHLRATVSSSAATIDYISSNAATNGQVLHSYTISAIALPVKMEYFTARTDNDKVILKWKTSAEEQSKQFIVQREVSSASGFKDIGTVAALNAARGGTYEFIDVPDLNGAYLYRIAQEDIDGKISYSETRKVALNGLKAIRVINKGNSWHLVTDQTVQYHLIDTQGRVLETGSFSGSRLVTKPISGNLYFLRIAGADYSTVQKLVK